MMTRRRTKYIHEGHLVAALEVSLLEDETGWSPYLSVEDARLLKIRRQQPGGTVAETGGQ